MPSFSKNALFAFLSSCLLFQVVLKGQHPSWQNFTTRDGLPSNEIYGMLQDSRGLLWFSTDLGICHFNGYEFIRPVDTSATASASTFQIVEDAQGRIWFMHLDGTLSIIENDTVRSWPYNHLSKSFKEQYYTSWHFAVGKDSAVWLSSFKSGFLVVQPDGAQQIVPSGDRHALIFSEISGQIVSATAVNRAIAERFSVYGASQKPEIICWQNGKAISQGYLIEDPVKESNVKSYGVFRRLNGDFLGFHRQTFFLIRNDQLIWQGQKSGIPETIFEDSNGNILLTMSGGKNQGLLRFRSFEHFQRDESDNLLPGQEVHLFIRDREGGWWVSSKNGIFYCKNPNLDIFDTTDGLPSVDVKTLTSDGRERVYAGLRQLDIAVFQHSEGHPELLPRPPIYEMRALRFDTLTNKLWCSMDLCFWEKGRWTYAKRAAQDKSNYPYIPAQKITSDLTGVHWWASATYNFFSIDPQNGTASITPNKPKTYLRKFSITPDQEGDLWVTTDDGLRLYRSGHYELPPFYHPALRFQARNVEFLPMVVGGGMVIALRGGGLLMRDKGGIFTYLTTHDGLTSDVLSDLDITPDGRIYACSNAGLNILTRQPDGHWKIENLTTKHGLPSNQVNDVVLLGDEIWVATDRGIARIREIPAPTLMPAPVLEKFSVNNQEMAFSPNLRLAYGQSNLSLRFFALHFRSGGDIPYRYRLLPADTSFNYTHTRTANFSLLSSGRYVFEIQAQNEDGQWSEPSRWAFEIRPPWWATWWFRALASTALLGSAYLFYRNRIYTIRQEAALHEKVRDLETAALRAQMNPHFIFNCLQAIQSFIATNDRYAAASYLARFAKLVRLALHSSVDGRHTLFEEMAMLENYLYLEQLRFGGSFEFTVRAKGNLDSEAITLPPLLVQPFVENALLHGLQGKESDGKIEVIFTRNGDLLEVSVTDNGIGFSEDKEASNTSTRPYKSLGMMLTQKRLDLLAGVVESGEEYLKRETLWDDMGGVMGARIRLSIPLIHE